MDTTNYRHCATCGTVLPINATNDKCHRHGGTVRTYAAPPFRGCARDHYDARRDARLTR